MAQLKEFKSLYLAEKGIDEKGRKLSKDEKVEKAKALELLRENIMQHLCKAYAQLELAKEIGWYDEDEVEKIVDSAKHNELEKVGTNKRKNGFKKEYKDLIIKACKSAEIDCDFKEESKQESKYY